jgi:ABC-2 type transport system ATP-binding protein
MKQENIVIDVRNLKKSYGDNQVLKGVNFQVERGTMLALLGPNGAGKTTTVRILSTLLQADAGTALVEGNNVSTNAEEVRKVIGLTGQSAAVDEMLTGRENLVMMGRLYRLTARSAKARADELLKEFDLVDAADRPSKTYSGGMRRRLDLAVSLIAVPPVIFLDEPTTGLDPRSRLVMWDIIKKLMNQGTTILLTTQYLEEADQLADKIILINDGTVAAEGTAKELKSKIGNDQLVLSFSDAESCNQAQKKLGKKAVFHDEETNSLTFGIRSTGADVRQILETLHEANIQISSMDIHKPTLDDVFLAITDKTAKKGKKN